MATRRKSMMTRRSEVDPAVWNWLLDANPDEINENGDFSFEIFMLDGEWVNCRGSEKDKLRQLWFQVEDEVLNHFINRNPGWRPKMWWRYSAPMIPSGSWPRVAGTYLDGRIAEPRHRVGGRGVASHDFYPAWAPAFEWGVPAYWEGCDPEDPPQFESQACYLRRHGLLTAEEQRRLPVDAFEPETIRVPEGRTRGGGIGVV
jgi:hypothetical protein